jgi:hypothetical protein
MKVYGVETEIVTGNLNELPVNNEGIGFACKMGINDSIRRFIKDTKTNLHKKQGDSWMLSKIYQHNVSTDHKIIAIVFKDKK